MFLTITTLSFSSKPSIFIPFDLHFNCITFDLSLSLVTVENTSNLNILCSSLANVVKSVNTGFLPSVVS